MKDHSGCSRAFCWTGKAWYANVAMLADIVDEVMFGMYDLESGGTTGEIAMRWGKLGPRLQAYNDAWSALALFTDVIQKLGEVGGQNISPKEFTEILLDCGFVDSTPYDSPYKQLEEV